MGIQTSCPLLCVQAPLYPTYGEESLVVYSIGKWNFNSEETQWLMGMHTSMLRPEITKET